VVILWSSFAVMALTAVTGSTGNIGGRVARHLAQKASSQRLIVRDASRAPELGAEVAAATYSDASAVRAALAGVATLFMVSGAEAADRVDQHRTFIDAAAAAGVARIVYLSYYGAAPDATFTLARDHWATEAHIKSSGMAWTFLRDNLYADFAPLLVGQDGAIRGPAGDGVAAVVVQDDIAEAAAEVLADPAAHDGRTYSLTGPEALSCRQMAAMLSAASGREIRYVEETLEEAYASRAVYRAPMWQVDAWVSTYTSIANGEMAGVTEDVHTLTGHSAMTLGASFSAIPSW